MSERHQPSQLLTRLVDRLLQPSEVRAQLSIGRTTESNLRRSDPSFPQRVRVSPGRFAYRESEIQAWIAARPAVAAAPAPEHAAAARRAKRAAKATPAAPAKAETTGA